MLDTFDKVALCTGYKVGDDVYTEFPGDPVALETAEPQYEWMEGWKTSTAGARSVDDLPDAARRYLDRIESLCETPITYISVGTRRDQIIEV